MAPRRPIKRNLNDLTDQRVGLYCRVSQSDPDNPDPREKSTTDQEAVGRAWAERVGATIVDVYSDEGISASRFTGKQRAEFDRMLDDVRAGKLDVIWFWEASRLSRRPSEFHSLQELCRDRGVLWVNQDKAVDPGDYKDMLQAGILAVVDATASEQTSERVRRGMESIARAGRPAGKNAYGYRRVYDPVTRRLERVEPDVYDVDGRAVEDSPAAVVREIFERIAAGESLESIRRDFHARGIPSPRGDFWYPATIRSLALNPRYIARRVHQGEILDGVTTMWPPLVPEELFWSVQRILTDPKRSQHRPARAHRLLSGVIRCAVCGRKMWGNTTNRRKQPNHGGAYTCRDLGHTSIEVAVMDPFVERKVIGWLSDPGVFDALSRVDDSAATAQARADADQAHVQLEEWRRAAEAGDVTLETFIGVERGMLARIAEADRRSRSMAVPSILRGRLGPHVEQDWRDAETMPLEIKRQVIAEVADIRVRPVGTGWRHDPAYRVEWTWLMGPGEHVTMYPPDQPVSTDEAAVLAELVANGPTTQKAMPERLGWAQPGDRSALGRASYVMRRLERAGLITRTKVPRAGESGRSTLLLQLTDAAVTKNHSTAVE